MKQWLRAHLGHRELHVGFAAAFGSVTRDYVTRDVDIVVQLKPAPDRRLRRYGIRVKGLGQTFYDEFNIPLHVQLFASTEADALVDFAVRAESIEVLIGEEYWTESSALSTSHSSEKE